MKNDARQRKRESMEFYEKYVFSVSGIPGKIQRVNDKDLNHMGISFKCTNKNLVCYLSTATCWGDNGIDKKSQEPFQAFTVRYGIHGSGVFCERSEYEHLMNTIATNDPILDQIFHIQTYSNKDRDGIEIAAITKTRNVLQMIHLGLRSVFKNSDDLNTFYSVSWKQMQDCGYDVRIII
jgi:hypothetical protein